MAADAKLDLLRGVPLFARLSRRDLERVGQLADEIDVPAGKVLMAQRDSGTDMFVIASGRVKVERDGRHINDLGPGDWFGEMALLAEGPRLATVTTTEPARLFVIAHREFHSVMSDMPTVRDAILSGLASRIRDLEPEAAH